MEEQLNQQVRNSTRKPFDTSHHRTINVRKDSAYLRPRSATPALKPSPPRELTPAQRYQLERRSVSKVKHSARPCSQKKLNCNGSDSSGNMSMGRLYNDSYWSPHQVPISHHHVDFQQRAIRRAEESPEEEDSYDQQAKAPATAPKQAISSANA